MASLRDIRRKIGTVKNIAKITQAMKMVAAARLRKAQERVDASRPYTEKMRELLAAVVPQVPEAVIAAQPVLQVRDEGPIGLVLLTSDRGLCGSYNHNIMRKALEFIRERQAEGVEVELITIGRKAGGFMRNRGVKPAQHFSMVGVDAPFSEVQVITQAVVDMYTRSDNPVREIHIAFTRFVNAVMQRPVIERFLPFETGDVLAAAGEAAPVVADFEFDPDAATLMAQLLPRMVDNQVFQYLLEATASEYGARMTAMSKASDNAGEMIGTLTLQYNRARQDAITKELLDIVGGARALAED